MSSRMMSVEDISAYLKVGRELAKRVHGKCGPVTERGFAQWIRRMSKRGENLAGPPRGRRPRMATAGKIWRALGVPDDVWKADLQECGRRTGWVYFIEAVGTGRLKIGWSKSTPEDRLASLQCGCPFQLRELFAIEGTEAAEHWLQRACVEARVHGEWFHMTDDLMALLWMMGAR